MNAVVEKKLEALCYDKQDSSNRTEVVYHTYLGGMDAEEIALRVEKLIAEGCANVRALTWAEYEAVEMEYSKVKYNMNVPSIIDKDRFWEMLEVLPPCRWTKQSDFESFYVSECISGSLFSFFVRLFSGESAEYFEVVADYSITQDELRELCMNARKQA